MQSSLAILIMRYLEFQDIWNFFRDPLRIYDLLPFKKSGYLEYSACGWTKFAYITLHSVMWFFKASTLFLNIVLTVS